jgi:uroporphyrinogen-III decarboxylase
MEAKAGNDVFEYADAFGDRISFMGNMNVVKLRSNDEAVVRAEVEGKLRELRRRRIPYVFHSDHSIPPDVRYETYRFVLNLYRENAAYA